MPTQRQQNTMVRTGLANIAKNMRLLKREQRSAKYAVVEAQQRLDDLDMMIQEHQDKIEELLRYVVDVSIDDHDEPMDHHLSTSHNSQFPNNQNLECHEGPELDLNNGDDDDDDNTDDNNIVAGLKTLKRETEDEMSFDPDDQGSTSSAAEVAILQKRQKLAEKQHSKIEKAVRITERVQFKRRAGADTGQLSSEDLLQLQDQQKPYVCHVCERSFKRPQHLKSHLFNLHGEVDAKELKYPCGVCNQAFIWEWDLRRHERQSHSEKHGWYKCDECDGDAGWKREARTLQAHLEKVHDHKISVGEVKKQFYREDRPDNPNRCVCDKVLDTITALKQHMRSDHVTKVGLGQYRCDLCEDTFAVVDALNEHMMLHTVNVRKT